MLIQLLSVHLQVVLASNSGPALNDVTNSELQILTESIAAMDPVIQWVFLKAHCFKYTKYRP